MKRRPKPLGIFTPIVRVRHFGCLEQKTHKYEYEEVVARAYGVQCELFVSNKREYF